MPKRILAILTSALLVAVANAPAASAQDDHAGGALPPAGEFLTIGDVAPPMDVAHWLQGREIGEFEPGVVYIINFWSTWCKFCQASMPGFSSLQRDYEPYDVVVASISDERLQTVYRFLSQTEWKEINRGAIATDPDRSTQKDFMSAAGHGEIPTTFIVGREGLIEWIGHPRDVESVLRKLVDGTWDREAFRIEYEERMQPAYTRARMMRRLRDAYRERDFDTLIGLFEQAIDEVENPLQLKSQMFMLMIGEMNHPQRGYELGRALLEECWDDARLLNSMAWFVVDGESVADRDLDFAFAAAERAVELTRQRNAPILDTLARVYYEQGDLESALKWQRKAVDQLRSRDAYEDVIRSALRRYEREAASQAEQRPDDGAGRQP